MPTLIIGPRHNGVAGQYSYPVDVTYPVPDPGPNDNTTEQATVVFMHNVFGGPITLITTAGQFHVDSAVKERHGGQLTPDWIRSFYR
jgi:hypothetical protein